MDLIPAKYMPIQDQDLGAVGGEAAEMETDVYDLEDPETIAKLTRKLNEKMRITKAGLLFSGPIAYISNMSYAPITVPDSPPHDSNEEAYQFRKATDHGCNGLAEAVLKMEDAQQIQRETADIETTTEWKEDAPNKLWKLFDIKMSQHPELRERLLETWPLSLIEASWSKKWGGGAPLSIQNCMTRTSSSAKMASER